MIKKTEKVIGIPGYMLEEKMFGAGTNHLEFIRRFGNPRIIMPWEEKVDIDLLYLPGGLDTAPGNYGEVPSFYTSNQDVFKEFFFKERLKNYIDADVPVFGVCLGMQQLGVYFGCKLTQDLLFHAQSPERWAKAHRVHSATSSLAMEVNSHHHQCVTEENLSEDVDVTWWAADNEDNHLTGEGRIVEGIQVGDRIYGVQWHPEELYDKYSIAIMNKLLEIGK